MGRWACGFNALISSTVFALENWVAGIFPRPCSSFGSIGVEAQALNIVRQSETVNTLIVFSRVIFIFEMEFMFLQDNYTIRELKSYLAGLPGNDWLSKKTVIVLLD